MSAAPYILGLDLGGTNLKALAITPAGTVVDFVSSDSSGADWQQNARTTVLALENKHGQPVHIGVAAPGLVSASGRAIQHMPGRLAGLEGLDWTEFLGAPAPVSVVNDAHAALLGEIWQGAAKNQRNVILITIGTGVGGAAMVDGHLLRGHMGRAGHLGHITLDPRGAPDIVKTPGSLEQAIGHATLRQRSHGRYSTMLQLADDVRNGNRAATVLWRRMIEDLAAAIASLINVLDPAMVVIGGGVSEAGDILFTPLRMQLAEFEWRPSGHGVAVVPAQLGQRAGAYGAAWLATQKTFPHESNI